MATQITNYQCPACTGPLKFGSGSGKMECEYCGSIFDVEEIEGLYANKEQRAEDAFRAAEEQPAETDWDVSGAREEWQDEHIRAYSCPSCAAELICDDTTAATSCPYCGNPTVVPGQLSGTWKPDYVIPFKLDKNAAVEALKKHYKGKPFLPKTFASQNHIEEVKGVYVPFWLFDGKAYAEGTYRATRSRVRRTQDEEITITDHFMVRRAGNVAFARIPVDGSTKMPDDLMDSIEPYNYDDLTEFSTAYLPGFLADKYDVSAEAAMDRADTRAKNTALEAIASSASRGYQTCVPVHTNVRLERGQVKYALMPVWLLSTKWNGKNYLFAMNGQTGRMVGDMPVSWVKFWITFAGLSAGLTLLLSMFI